VHKGVTGEMRVTEIFETSVIDSLERVAFFSFVWNDVAFTSYILRGSSEPHPLGLG